MSSYSRIDTVQIYLKRVIGGITLEPALFLQVRSVDKCCRDLGYEDEICSDINHFKLQNNKVQQRANIVNMYISILSTLPSIFLALFLGPWSDKNGRKPVMVVASFGYFVAQLAWIHPAHFKLLLCPSCSQRWGDCSGGSSASSLGCSPTSAISPLSGLGRHEWLYLISAFLEGCQ